MTADTRLLETARAALASGPLHEDDLARRVYRVVGPVDPWRPLMHALLARSDEFERDPDGRWIFRAEAPQTPLVMAGRSTRARGGRLLALALAPADTLEPLHRWHFTTDKRASAYVRRSFSLDEDRESEAIPFEDAASEVAAVIGRRLLIVLDARLPALLSLEFELCSMPPPCSEVRTYGQHIWAGGGTKRTLATVRTALGLIPEPADELRSELEVLMHLHHTENVGEKTQTASPQAPGHRERLRLAADGFPEGPGVYIFRTADGEALYVGSAVNLRRRALSYFAAQIEITRSMSGLLERAVQVEYIQLGTHLEALLEESILIANLRPPYNVQREVSSRPAWLRIGAEPEMNVVQIASTPRQDEALYLGPLPNRAAVSAVAGVLAGLWGFRRRGGSVKSGEASLARLAQLRSLLSEPDRFRAEMRSRFHAVAPDLHSRRRSKLAEQVERSERAVDHGDLKPVDAAARSSLVARLDLEQGQLYLLVVRDLTCLACARVSALDATAIDRAVAQLLTCRPVSDPPLPGAASLTLRWLHAHREDRWVLPINSVPEETVTCLAEAVAAAYTEGEGETSIAEATWWDQD